MDLDSLRAARSSGTVTPRLDRRPDLFQFVSAFHTPNATAEAESEGPLGDQLDATSTQAATAKQSKPE